MQTANWFRTLGLIGLALIAPHLLQAADAPLVGTTRFEGLNLLAQVSAPIDAAIGWDGDLYVSGVTEREDLGTPLAFQPTPPNLILWSRDHSTLSRLSPTGERTFTSYLGGSGPFSSSVYNVATDPQGYAYVSGLGDSRDFPLKNPTGHRAPEGIDTYLMKISPDGHEVIYSTLLGGKDLDFPAALSVNEQGEAFVAGYSTSSDFQTVPEGPGCLPYNGQGLLFVSKFSKEGGLLFSRRFPQSGNWNPRRLATDAHGGVWVGGHTSATLLPGTPETRIQRGALDPIDGFVVHLDASGSPTAGRFLGGAGLDSVTALAILPDDELLVGIQTTSQDYPGADARFAARTESGLHAAVVQRLSADAGVIRWTRRFPFSNAGSVSQLKGAPDGRVAALIVWSTDKLHPNDPEARTRLVLLDGATGGVSAMLPADALDRGALDLRFLSPVLVRVAGTAMTPVAGPAGGVSGDPVVSDLDLRTALTLPGAEVWWTSPTADLPALLLPAPAQSILPLKLGVVDWQGTADRLEIHDNGVLLAQWTQPPFELSWTNPPAGLHQLRAVLRNAAHAILASADTTCTIEGAVSQDVVRHAVQIDPAGGSVRGSLLGCDGAPDNSALEVCGNSAWFSWTAPAKQKMAFDAFSLAIPSPEPLNLQIYSGSTVSALAAVNTVPGGPVSTHATFQAEAGSNYLVRVSAAMSPNRGAYRADSHSGIFQLTLSPASSPSNDDREAAQVLAGDAISLHGTTVDATRQLDDGNFGQVRLTNTVWYSWTPAGSGLFLIHAAAEQQSVPLRLKLIKPDGTVLPASASVDRGLGFTATSGVTYSIAVGSGAAGTPFELSIHRIEAPATGAVPKSGASWESTAILFPMDPPQAIPAPQWIWTAPSNGTYRISARGEFSGATLTVKLPTSSSPFKQAGSDPNATNPLSGRIDLLLGAEAGSNYVIGFAAAVKSVVTVHLAPEPNQPPNDSFAAAAPWLEDMNALSGTVLGASPEAGERFLAHPQESVWYRWTATSASQTLITFEADNCLNLILHSGNSLDALTPVATNRTDNTLRYRSVPGVEYRLQVISKCSLATLDTFVLRRRTLAANDEFGGATILTGEAPIAGLVMRDTTLSATDPAITGPAPGSGWWSWTPPVDGTYRVRVTGESSEPILRFFRAQAVGAPVSVFPLMSFTNTAALRVEAIHSLRSTNAYLIEMLSPCEQTFHLEISAIAAPENDNIAARLPLSGVPATADADVMGATVDGGNPRPAAGLSLWWSWVPPQSGLYQVSTTGSEFAPRITAIDGPSLPTPSSRLYEASGDTGTTSALILAEAGREIVLGLSYATGLGTHLHFTIDEFPMSLPTNDAFDHPAALSGDAVELSGLLQPATYEADEPHGSNPFSGGSVWYQWTPTAAGDHFLSIQTQPGYAISASVYTGDLLTSLVSLANVDTTFTASQFVALDGPVRLQVFGAGTPAGVPFRLRLMPGTPPSNDAFSNAEPLSSLSGTVSAHPVWATSEPGEPGFTASLTCTNTLWYTFIAPTNGPMRFQGAQQSGGFALFTGSALTSLQRVPGVIDIAGGIAHFSYTAAQETRYFLQASCAQGSDPWIFEYSLADAPPVVVVDPPVSHLLSFWADGGSGREIRLLLQEPVGSVHVLELSPDLSQWIPVLTNRSFGLDLEIPAPMEPASDKTFYRLRQLP